MSDAIRRRSDEWAMLRPEVERIVFCDGFRAISDETQISASTLYDALSGCSVPTPRTLRDLRDIVSRRWHGFSETERSHT